MTRITLLLVLLGGPMLGSRAAETTNSAEASLRAAFRDANSRREAAEAEVQNLKASLAAATEENKSLAGKYEALKKQVVADRAVTDKTAASLGVQVTEQKATIAQLKEALAKTKDESDKAALAWRGAEAQGTKLTNLNAALERRASDLETKNLALFMLGNQILTRYEEFSLGNAIKAKEPFVGLTRTRLENLVQEYQDKLLDQRAVATNSTR